MSRRRQWRVPTVLSGIVVAVTMVTVLFASDPPAAPTSRPAAVDGDRIHVRALIARLGRRPDEARESQTRMLSTPRAQTSPRPAGRRPGLRGTLAEAVTRRTWNRAYEGAPPVMPHSRNFVRTKSCLDCHTDGIWLGGRYGPPVSHPTLLNCLQCHVEARNLDLTAPEFVSPGLPATHTWQSASRAWPGAPPVMPHPMMMRTNCLSCHGPSGQPGLATTHPERTNCVQCHAVGASLDQTSPFFTGRSNPPAPSNPIR